MSLSAGLAPLQFGGLFSGPVGSLLIALVVIALVVLVGRIALNVAWRLVTIAVTVVALVWVVLTFLLPAL
jgi:hypothetical protein